MKLGANMIGFILIVAALASVAIYKTRNVTIVFTTENKSAGAVRRARKEIGKSKKFRYLEV